MEIELAVLCDGANGLPDGRINILGQFKQYNTFQFPFQVPGMALVMRISASTLEQNTTHSIKTVVIDQDGKVLAPPAQINVTVPQAPVPVVEMVAILGINGLTYQRPGEYRVDVTIDDQSKAQIIYKVNAVPPPPGFQVMGHGTPPRP